MSSTEHDVQCVAVHLIHYSDPDPDTKPWRPAIVGDERRKCWRLGQRGERSRDRRRHWAPRKERVDSRTTHRFTSSQASGGETHGPSLSTRAAYNDHPTIAETRRTAPASRVPRNDLLDSDRAGRASHPVRPGGSMPSASDARSTPRSLRRSVTCWRHGQSDAHRSGPTTCRRGARPRRRLPNGATSGDPHPGAAREPTFRLCPRARLHLHPGGGCSASFIVDPQPLASNLAPQRPALTASARPARRYERACRQWTRLSPLSPNRASSWGSSASRPARNGEDRSRTSSRTPSSRSRTWCRCVRGLRPRSRGRSSCRR